jgi:hypothetical protein
VMKLFVRRAAEYYLQLSAGIIHFSLNCELDENLRGNNFFSSPGYVGDLCGLVCLHTSQASRQQMALQTKCPADIHRSMAAKEIY